MWSLFTPRRVALAGTAALLLFLAFFHTPQGFVPDTLVSIPRGASFSEAAKTLKRSHVITSAALLRVSMIVGGGAEKLKAGDYYFSHPENVLVVARRLLEGRYELATVRVLLPEGSSTKDMGKILAGSLPRIDAATFSREAHPYEGYLFPDTYFLLPTATSGDAIAVLRSTFDEKTKDLASSTKEIAPFSDIVIMASLLEEEARTFEDKRIVAGILWKRLREGKRLQVDAPFAYILGKASHELTSDDLKLDSPYNTYLHEGLPPTPITNPGLQSLQAAYDPLETPYWFYLSDDEGVLHYAETFEEHVENKRRYLR